MQMIYSILFLNLIKEKYKSYSFISILHRVDKLGQFNNHNRPRKYICIRIVAQEF